MPQRKERQHSLYFILALTVNALACNAFAIQPPNASADQPSSTAPAVATPAITNTPLSSPTSVPTIAPTDAPVPTATPFGYCAPPNDDYGRVEIRGETINNRTYQMLLTAQQIYMGPGNIRAVTQGSYRADVSVSFNTHAGGGAVDISIRNPNDSSEILWDEAEPMVIALRWAGFAAWYRPPDAVGQGSAPHIHAIGIGDKELSPDAADQLTGPAGYFRGLDGLPPPNGSNPDPYGGPVICDWMLAAGYEDLR